MLKKTFATKGATSHAKRTTGQEGNHKLELRRSSRAYKKVRAGALRGSKEFGLRGAGEKATAPLGRCATRVEGNSRLKEKVPKKRIKLGLRNPTRG